MRQRGAGLLVATLDGLEQGALDAREQQLDALSLAPKVTVDDAHVDWRLPAVAIDRQVRACTPAPGAWTLLGEERLKLGPVAVAADQPPLPPGRVLVTKHAVFVGTATQPVRLGDVRPFGKKQMAAADWARGVRLDPDTQLA